VRHGGKSLNTKRKASNIGGSSFVTSGLPEEEGLPTGYDAFDASRSEYRWTVHISLVKDYVSQGRENAILITDSLGIITANRQCTLTGKSPTISALLLISVCQAGCLLRASSTFNWRIGGRHWESAVALGPFVSDAKTYVRAPSSRRPHYQNARLHYQHD
jgi:hypothetical protein